MYRCVFLNRTFQTVYDYRVTMLDRGISQCPRV